eukprot:8832239-Pyramimonas_sp.AAC.1
MFWPKQRRKNKKRSSRLQRYQRAKLHVREEPRDRRPGAQRPRVNVTRPRRQPRRQPRRPPRRTSHFSRGRCTSGPS